MGYVSCSSAGWSISSEGDEASRSRGAEQLPPPMPPNPQPPLVAGVQQGGSQGAQPPTRQLSQLGTSSSIQVPMLGPSAEPSRVDELVRSAPLFAQVANVDEATAAMHIGALARRGLTSLDQILETYFRENPPLPSVRPVNSINSVSSCGSSFDFDQVLPSSLPAVPSYSSIASSDSMSGMRLDLTSVPPCRSASNSSAGSTSPRRSIFSFRRGRGSKSNGSAR